MSWILCSYSESFLSYFDLYIGDAWYLQHRAACFVLNRPSTQGHHDSITEILATIFGLDYFRDPKKSLLLATLLFKILNHNISIPDQYIAIAII